MAMAIGKTIAIEQVPDEVFSSKMMGDGIAIIPEIGKIYAPCNGKVTLVMEPSHHAIGIECVDGLEILIHVGLDTVELLGEGFHPIVKVGDEIETGEELLDFDIDLLKAKGINLITMLVVVDNKGKQLLNHVIDQTVKQSDGFIVEYK